MPDALENLLLRIPVQAPVPVSVKQFSVLSRGSKLMM